jgi:hypothetical protein
MACKLIAMAETHWRKLDAAPLLPRVRAGTKFVAGVQLERQANDEDRKAAA